MKLNSKQLRSLDENKAKSAVNQHQNKRQPIYFIVENVYDTYNVGGLFRLADALNVAKIYLCGETEIPPNHKIVKASIGTYKIVPWEYKTTAKDAIDALRSTIHALRALAIEQAKGSIDYREAKYGLPLALIVGNETSGVTEETLKLCDQVVEIPMWGVNTSLNVIVSAAIVGFKAVELL